MNVAIVGTSKLTDKEKIEAYKLVNLILDSYTNQITVVSGGAVGIDMVAESVAIHRGLKTDIIKPKGHFVEDYMSRNRDIALKAHDLYCITTKAIKTTKCYHHGKEPRDHQKTAGCYTMAHALDMHKPCELFII